MVTRLPELSRRLEQSFCPPEISQRPEIGQCEGEAILILIPHFAQGEAAEFKADSTTIPVIRSLRCRVLHKSQLGIESYIGGNAETPFTRVPITQ